MKRFFLLVVLLALIIFPRAARAQYSCGSCCPGSTRTCSNISCTANCTNTPSCTIGPLANLAYVGNNNLTATLSWSAATNATAYNLVVTRDDGVILLNVANLAALNYTTPALVKGRSYTWVVTPRHNCGLGTPANGPLIGVPNQGSVTINRTGVPTCIDSTCNGQDLIVAYDGNHNQIVPFTVTFTDPNPPSGSRFSDFQKAYVLFDNDINTASSQYRVAYLDNGDGTFTLTEDGPSGARDQNIEVVGATRAVSADKKTLTLNFSLDLNGLAKEQAFLANVYLNAYDFSGLVTGRALKIGTGDFTDPPVDPYTGASISALDVWNGRDVLVDQANYYEVINYTSVCTQASLPSPVSLNSVASYSPGNPGSWLADLLAWDTNGYYQPYYHYNGGNYEVTYTPSDSSYYYTGISTERYGEACSSGNGTVKSNFKNGGLRVDDSNVGDRTLDVAFAVLPVSEAWSQTVDGSYFANSNIGINISPLTCSGCFFTTKSNSPTNGLLLVNGQVVTSALDAIGDPNNWYAQTQSVTKPFTSFELPAYDEIKALYQGAGFTELNGDQTTGVGGLADPLGSNKTIFINGNLTINSSTLLRAALNNYLLFVVNGNITITNSVKDPDLSTSAIQAMLVALDNGSGTGNITIQDDPADDADLITIEGSLVSGGVIDFQRDLYINNNYGPAVRIIYRPDMLTKMQADNVAIINLQRMLVSQY